MGVVVILNDTSLSNPPAGKYQKTEIREQSSRPWALVYHSSVLCSAN